MLVLDMKYNAYGAANYDPAVGMVQGALARMGFTDCDGKSLAIDGVWGAKTNCAMAAFYKVLGKPQPSSLTQEVVNEVVAAEQRGVKNRTPQPDPNAPPGATPPGEAPPGTPPPPTDWTSTLAIVGAGLVVAGLILSGQNSGNENL